MINAEKWFIPEMGKGMSKGGNSKQRNCTGEVQV